MNGSENAYILNAIIEYILTTERFNLFYLNKCKPSKCKLLQLITTTVTNDKIVFELGPPLPFQFLFTYSIVSQIYLRILYLEIAVVSTTFYTFYFSFVGSHVIVQTLDMYLYAIVFELNTPFQFLFIYSIVSQIYQGIFMQRLFLFVPLFIYFIFILYLVM